MGLFNFYKDKSKNKAVFTGLDSSGKSTIISFLQKGKFVEHAPTMGKVKKEIDVNGTLITLIDIGGQKNFRDLWLGELSNAKAMVFVIDKADTNRFDEARTKLMKLLPIVRKNNIKLLIFANKHDLENAVSLGEIIKAFDLTNMGNFEIMETSAKTGYGLVDAFSKFYSALTGEKIKKRLLAKAISVFNKGGVPIITENIKDIEINQVALEGGFLAAISHFSESKLKDTKSIHFKSEENGTFIVVRSQNFLGSLLWTEDLGVPIDQSETALTDLLDHLEKVSNWQDEDNVAFHVEHYITNMM